MTKLCARGKAAAKRKFKVYPSAYANAYASKICAGKIKDPSGMKRKDWGPKGKKSGGQAIYKAAMGRAQFSTTTSKPSGYIQKEKYNGSYIKGDLAGQEVSNESLSNYYKELL